MSLASLLLNHPIPRDSIELGRLVLDPKYPSRDFCQPSVRPTADDETTQRLQDFYDIIQRARGTRLELNLLELLSAAGSISSQSSTAVSAPLCVIHELGNAVAFFETACREPKVRDWLETESQRRYSTIYLISGFRVLTDATVELARLRQKGVDTSAAVPAAVVIGAATGVPVPIPLDSGLEVGGGLARVAGDGQRVGYKAAGEQVFAVQYRKVRFSRFSSNKADKAYLEKGSHWKSYLSTRAGGEESEDVIAAEVAEAIGLQDLMGSYESLELDEDNSEELLFRVD